MTISNVTGFNMFRKRARGVSQLSPSVNKPPDYIYFISAATRE